MYNNNYITQGVTIKPNVIAEGDKVTLSYNGILVKSGADAIWAHIGYGDGPEWHNTSYVKMAKTSEGFEANITVNESKNLNIAFKDSANNWDNNNGNNYIFNVQTR